MGFIFPLFLFLGIGAIALFTFLAVSAFSNSRAKERIAFYKSETYRKLAELPPEQAEPILQEIRQEERCRQREDINSVKLTGLIMIMVGLGHGIFMYAIVENKGVALSGLIPLGVGLALFLYSTLMAPRPEEIIPRHRKE